MLDKSIFSFACLQYILDRVELLTPESQPIWGKMQVSQMLAHVSIPMECAMEKIHLPIEGSDLLRPAIRWFVLMKRPFPKSIPAPKGFIVSYPCDFETEKQRLLQNLEETYQLGVGRTWPRHHAFGNLSTAQWGFLMTKHLDHHLRQFAV